MQASDMRQEHTPPRLATESIPESTSTAQPIERKRPALALAPRLAEECLYRWLYGNQSTRDISRRLRIHDRNRVEFAIRDRLRSGPLTAPGMRGAA